MLEIEKASCTSSEDGTLPVICIQDLAVAYQTTVALFDVNFDIYRGEYVGILGPNGSGKTTLLKAILGLIKPVQGHVRVSSEDVMYKNRNQNLSKIGYVPQVHNIDKNFPALVEDVVMAGRYGKIGLFRRATPQDRKIVNQALRTVEMERFAKRPIGHLSGGQQQKVIIARSLAQEPEVLLLDEPTTALDFKIAKSMMELISKLHTENNLTIILVSHNIRALREHVNRVICLDKTVIWMGAPGDPELDTVIENVFYQ
ncbi:MAG: metal ABC transporter ATP-binding protein [Candidatus Hermodarchaeota archaeon]